MEKRSAPDDLRVDSVASRRRILISVFGVAFAAIGSVLFGWIADLTFGRDVWQAFVPDNFELVIGTPMAAALAFCIVMIFYGSFEGPLKMKIGILEIGPGWPDPVVGGVLRHRGLGDQHSFQGSLEPR